MPGTRRRILQAFPAGPAAAEYLLPTTGRGIAAQAAAALGMLTGLWVALSPLFLTLQHGGTKANVAEVDADRLQLAEHLPRLGVVAAHRVRGDPVVVGDRAQGGLGHGADDAGRDLWGAKLCHVL